MSLSKRYNSQMTESKLLGLWKETKVYQFDPESEKPVYSIDTPPATVSGNLHMGHVYSYSHADFIARFWRMNGYNVFYPMGYDDNGLPTERLVERLRGVTASKIGRQAFINECLQLSEELEQEYNNLWERLGLSLDSRYTYRTIDDHSRRISQYSFIELYRKNLVYRNQAPTIWCPECRTAIAQAEVDDLIRDSKFFTILFRLDDGNSLPIATTRPELLPACVAVFVHPEDKRYQHLVGQQVTVPISGHQVPLLADSNVDPEKGTGGVMCCTFGDTVDVGWWRAYELPLRVILDSSGRMTDAAGDYAGLTVPEARQHIIVALAEQSSLLETQPIEQTVRVHERCDTPVEYIVTSQWYVRVLDNKDTLIEAGEQIQWHPPHLKAQYLNWVENLKWDWNISRQRYFGVAFPVWYCDKCGAIVLAEEEELPVDPVERRPQGACSCGSTLFTPETDVMDTWATSSLTPQITGRWLTEEVLFNKLFPMSLRPQAHEIIRTWAFYTIVKSLYHFDSLPWQNTLISGWGIAPQGTGKISKSRGGGPISPIVAFEKYSVDAARYWAASTSPGKDSVISEEKMGAGTKLVSKLWNVARFSERFLENYNPPHSPKRVPLLSSADRWILSRTHELVRRVTNAFQKYDYAIAKNETEVFFWTEFADNYIELAKRRLYNADSELHNGACYTLYQVLLTVLKLFAPIMPYVTEEIYQDLFASVDKTTSIHISFWPVVDEGLLDKKAEHVGATLLKITEVIRRYKSEQQLSLAAELQVLEITTKDSMLAKQLRISEEDIMSTTRAQEVRVSDFFGDDQKIGHIVYKDEEIIVDLVRPAH